MGGTSIVVWTQRAVFVLIASVLAWRIVVLGMAQFYADQIEQDATAAGKALAWYPQHPKALRHSAAEWEASDPKRAEDYLTRAWRGDLSHGRTLLRLASVWRRQGQLERADKACELAERLSPTDAPLRLQAAQYWLAAGKPQKTLRNWDLVMQISPATAPPLFPVLLNTAKSPAGLALLRPIVVELPPWWQPFFAYAAQNAAHVDTLRALYSLRKGAGRPFSLAEINSYLARLMREGLWAEAYMAWINALGAEQQSALGYLYDGGFELASFQGGFDWSVPATKSAQVTANYTQGIEGKKALHIVFRGKSAPSSLIEQTAFLLPGHYRLSGRVRPDALQVAAGLEWVLECAQGAGGKLASSERFLGSDTWRRFVVDFQVADEACSGVRLKLQPLSHFEDNREINGEIWFDDLAIEQAVASAEEAARPAALPQKKTINAPASDKGQSLPRKLVAKPPATKPPAQSGADTAVDRPGTLRRAAKTAPQAAPAKSGSQPPESR